MNRLIVAVAALVLSGCSTAQPAVERAVDGPFTLEITSARTAYASGEPIAISATLTYAGPAASAEIWHAYQTIGFGVDGLLDGNVQPIWALSCSMSELNQGEPLVVPFGKTGGTMTPDPAFDAFMADPVLRLPAGVWHVYAVAEFSESGCGDPGRKIRAEVVVTVGGTAMQPPGTSPGEEVSYVWAR